MIHPNWHIQDGYYPSLKEIHGPSFKISFWIHASDITLEQSFERMSDGKLICAAPTMLKALETVVRHAELAWCEHMVKDAEQDLNAIIDTAKAAIAKAKGVK